MKKALPKAELITAYTIFGTLGAFRKYVPMNSGLLCMYRGLIGALFLWLILTFKKQKINIPAVKKNLRLLILSGTAIGINWVLIFEAYKYTSVAIVSLCYYMAPIFMIIGSTFVLNEKITKTSIICISIALVGMALIFRTGTEEISTNSSLGFLLSISAAVLYATDMLCNKKMSNIRSLDRTVVQLFVAGLVIIPYVLFMEEPTHSPITFKIVAMVLIMGIVHTGIGFALTFDSLAKLDTQTVAVFTYIDPVLSVVLSAVLLKEGITVGIILGAICILGSALYNELKSN